MKLYFPIMASDVTIILGTILLLNKVPFLITVGSIIDIVLLTIAAYLIYKGIKYSDVLGFVLSIIQILGNSTDPVHLRALNEFGTTLYLSILDILMVLSFYVFPLTYITMFLMKRKSPVT